MPHLQELQRRGTSGVLRSTMPPYTAPAWTTFATGVQPGKHGCYDFLLPTDSLEHFTLCNSTRIRTSTIYELLQEVGKRSVLFNLPNSYPPRLNTPTITDMLTVGQHCVFPEALTEQYPILTRYRLSPNEELNSKGKWNAYVDDIIALEQDHMDAVKTLWENEKWDFFFYLFSSVDWISHAMFDRLCTGAFPKAYELFTFIDKQIGWFVEHLPQDTALFILSDHGFKVYQHTFYFNAWLEREGYLTTTVSAAESFHPDISKQDEQRRQLQQRKRWNVSVTKNTMRWLKKNQAIERLTRWFYHRVAKPFLPIRFHLDIGIDFSRTAVCFPKGRTMTAIYINDGRKYRNGIEMTEESYRKLRDEVKQKLENLKGPDGKPVTPRVYTKEEIYGSAVPWRCPDLFFEFGEYWFVGQFHSNQLFIDEVSNKHDPFGVFFAYGHGIRQGMRLEEHQIADVTPTILHSLGLPVPRYMDGKVIDIFSSPSPAHYSDRPLLREQQTIKELVEQIEI